MSGSDIFSADIIYKEVYIRKGVEDWNDINVNIGGVASTLQDVKTHYKAGAYSFKKIPNRFIYWRTENSVLEVVEECLDITLIGNQLRYRFTDSQILDGISITETLNRVFILVPTVSSLHVFKYSHPDKQIKKGLTESSGLSIFHGVSESSATDPQTYHLLNSSSSAIVSCTSCLTSSGEAVFALSLANATILLVTIDTMNGHQSSRTLSHTNIVPRLFTGLTDVLLGKEGGDWVGVNLNLHYIRKELFLFSLCRGGGLRVWSVDRAAHITSHSFKSLPGNIKGQKHKMCKGILNGTFVLHCCIQGCAILTVIPEYDDGSFKFTSVSEIRIKPGLEVTYMCPGDEGHLWCSWLTPDESPAITKNNVLYPELSRVALTRPTLNVKNSSFIPRDPASHYLNAIFSSGFFTAADIAKALAIYKITAVIKPNVDITEQICSIVETEIYSEVGDQELEDDEFLDIANRCWSRLYSCCSQYIISSMLPLGMVWLGNALILIQECGFSLVVEIEPVELFMRTSAKHESYPNLSFGLLLERIRGVDLDDAIEKLELSLHTGESLNKGSVLQEAAGLISLPPSKELDNALSVFYEPTSEYILDSIIEELTTPEAFSSIIKKNLGSSGDAFCSVSGVGAVTSAFRDFVFFRLKVCEKLLLITELVLKQGNEVAQRSHHRSLCLSALCKAYYILWWTCTTKSMNDAPLIHVFSLANQTSIMQSTMMDSVLALSNYIWPFESNNIMAQYLLSTKQYALLQALARLTGINSWSLMLAESYIITGQPGKAFDICLDTAHSNINHYLSSIRLFERHARSDLVIGMATKALELLNLAQSDKETLESALFVHELGMGNYDAAWSWIDACSSWSRRSDFLHRLVSNMISEGKLTDLISFSYTGLLDEFEKFLASRARSLPLPQAVNYYNILYAFHVKHENFKKASCVMLEKAMRADTTEMQWRCYGACLSSLMLVNDPQQAWLVRPNPYSQEESIDILEVEDIQREFELAGARFSLDNCSTDATKEEVIALCVSQRQFKTALRLANMCKLSCAPVIQAFTASCASLTEDAVTWHWLKFNDIDDLLITEKNAVEMCWRILERCILKYERKNETILHRACANELLVICYHLPTWLLKSYKKLNCSELLRLYLQHGYLEEASDLACEYLHAALGVGREDFNIDEPLHPMSAPLCMPLDTIDILLLELKHYNMDENLQKALNRYIDTVSRLTHEKPMLWQRKK